MDTEQRRREKMIFFGIMVFVSMIFTILGICFWRWKTPVGFWTGQEVKEDEITDVKAYNKENGIMWLGFSGLFWIAAFAGLFGGGMMGGICLFIAMGIGIPMLPFSYNRIYRKYSRLRGE